MPVPTQPGDKFIPTIWSRELLIALRKALVSGNLTNSNYEGDISDQGDTVKVNTPSSVAVSDYSGTVSWDDIAATQQEMVIDQADYFAFKVNDINQAQANQNLVQTFMQEAGYSMADEYDQFVFATMQAGAGTNNQIQQATLDESNIYDTLVDAYENLSLQNVPKSGRWAVLSPHEISALSKSSEFTSANDLGADTVRAGFSGRAAGFDIFESNNLFVDTPNTTEYRYLPYGNNSATTVAEQIVQTEVLRLQDTFADGVKGLHVYGGKVFRSEALGYIRTNT